MAWHALYIQPRDKRVMKGSEGLNEIYADAQRITGVKKQGKV